MLGHLLNAVAVVSIGSTFPNGYYTRSKITNYDPLGFVTRVQFEEVLLPAGSVYGKKGRSYHRGTCEGRVAYWERDEATYESWWWVPALRKHGRDVFGSTEGEEARSKIILPASIAMQNSEHTLTQIDLLEKEHFGVVFKGELISFSEGGLSRSWYDEVTGSRIRLYDESRFGNDWRITELIELREPKPNDVLEFSVSKRFPFSPIDPKGMFCAYFWLWSGKLEAWNVF